MLTPQRGVAGIDGTQITVVTIQIRKLACTIHAFVHGAGVAVVAIGVKIALGAVAGGTRYADVLAVPGSISLSRRIYPVVHTTIHGAMIAVIAVWRRTYLAVSPAVASFLPRTPDSVLTG